MTEKAKTTIEILNDLHTNFVGMSTTGHTDIDKIINILELLVDKVEELDGHTHTLS